jgi:hypothetical protein
MTTVNTQQVLDYILDQISKEFNISHQTLVEKYGSIETVSSAIVANTNNKKKVVRKVTKVVEVVTGEPKVEAEVEAVAELVVVVPVETPKKKVVRKATKVVEVVTEEPKVEAVVETVAELVVVVPVETPKKKVVRKATKVVEEPKVEAVVETVAEVVVVAPVETTKKKVVCKAARAVEVVTEEPKVEVVASTPEEKVKPAPKRIVKKVPDDNEINNVEVSTKFDNNCDEVEEANVYVDTQTYNDEDSDSLEPREINGVNYYVDSSNYVYHFETQDLIGKLDNKGDNIIFLSDF